MLIKEADANVAWYQERARKIISEIHSRGKDVVVVGGTGLYIKAILDDLNFPDTDPQVRNSLNALAEKIGGDAMFERLAKLDPGAALAIDRANLRRVIRALEVIEIDENGVLKYTAIGNNLLEGETFQYTVKANTWFGSRVNY